MGDDDELVLPRARQKALDHPEIEGSELEEVRRRDVAQRVQPVHFLPEEVLLFVEEEVAVGLELSDHVKELAILPRLGLHLVRVLGNAPRLHAQRDLIGDVGLGDEAAAPRSAETWGPLANQELELGLLLLAHRISAEISPSRTLTHRQSRAKIGRRCAAAILDRDRSFGVGHKGPRTFFPRTTSRSSSMGAKKNIDELIGRTLMDKDFRARLFANPDATLAAEGYEATPELLNAIKSANPDEVQAVAKGMEEQLANRKAAF
ncbi:hypothetical protein E8A74_34030 [Polyangium fumosum]|uniref:Uncharacterized protein n=3 Tax=Polyangium TaxID=55 RepID=A0A4U1J0I2_9BACT|nr:hypothetical protein E8A74_34030 [Polyangium fumosum]